MATISDVAARAGVSTATASRALNGKATVARELAERVHTAAEELDYRPHGPARSLRKQETAVLALIISDVGNPFFTALARGAEDVAHAAGYSVVLCNSDDDPEKERRYVDVALQERVAGMLISPTGQLDSAEMLRAHRTPVVAVDRPLPTPASSPASAAQPVGPLSSDQESTVVLGDTVLVNSRLAAKEATTHLADQGYTRIGCITGPSGILTADDRLAGYRDGLRTAKLRASAKLVRRCEYQAAGAKRAAFELLDQPEAPDALVVANSSMTIGVLEALAERQLRSGRDLGIVSFDDAPWATLVDPPLSVVAQPAYDLGAIGAQLLLARIGLTDSAQAEARTPQTTTLSAHLIVRGSSHQH